MAKKDFTTTILVDQSPEEAFNAINNVKGWWHGTVKGKSAKLKDEFTYRFEKFHFSKQKVVELIPNKKVVWLVTDSKLSFTEDQSEWTGTKIIFSISKLKGQTKIRFTHEGLIPKFECYGDCSAGWTGLLQKSLLSLIATGKGKKIF